MSEQEVLYKLFKLAELNALKKFEKNNKYASVYCQVHGSFVWAQSPEGSDYWRAISELVD